LSYGLPLTRYAESETNSGAQGEIGTNLNGGSQLNGI